METNYSKNTQFSAKTETKSRITIITTKEKTVEAESSSEGERVTTTTTTDVVKISKATQSHGELKTGTRTVKKKVKLGAYTARDKRQPAIEQEVRPLTDAEIEATIAKARTIGEQQMALWEQERTA